MNISETIYKMPLLFYLTHKSLNKMAKILQTTLLTWIFLTEIVRLYIKIYWNLFVGIQFIKGQQLMAG